MATKVAMEIGGIERQTEKAFLMNGYGWMPKSQVTFVEKNDHAMMIIPGWLFKKSGLSYWNFDGHRIGWAVDESDLMDAKDITASILS